MPADIAALLSDLMAETEPLLATLRSSDDGWDRETPAAGWTVRDQVTHLAYFDDATVQAATDPEAFSAHKAEVLADVDGYTTRVARANRAMPGPAALDWLVGARERLAETFVGIDPARRIPWYGPDMGPASAVTARIMETWAHGQDVYDGLDMVHPVTPALRQVAHLGVRTFANSFVSKRRAVPDAAVRVELSSPTGEAWEWGPAQAEDVVRGSAVDFCLVVTQRRHLNDTGLVTQGQVAAEWMSVAQAFAGPPGAGRQPGQFAAS